MMGGRATLSMCLAQSQQGIRMAETYKGDDFEGGFILHEVGRRHTRSVSGWVASCLSGAEGCDWEGVGEDGFQHTRYLENVLGCPAALLQAVVHFCQGTGPHVAPSLSSSLFCM